MRRLFLTLLALGAFAGCSKIDQPTGVIPADTAKSAPSSPGRYLAYQHSITIDAEEQKLAVIFEAGQAACRAATADACVVLESQINTGRSPSASLKFRVKASGIQKLIAALGTGGEVTRQSTSAIDLENPIEDASKKLAMLNDYRSKLDALMSRSNNDVDALIKLHRELAQVQSDLEAMTGTQAHLLQRVETEILNVSIGSTHNQAFGRPIMRAAAEFGPNLSQGVAAAITGIAYLIPWAIALTFFGWIGRKLWLRRRRLAPRA